MKQLKNIWAWIQSNFPLILLAVVFFVYAWANAVQTKTRITSKEEEIACKSLCFPQQSEYLKQGDAAACWCYVDEHTISKAK